VLKYFNLPKEDSNLFQGGYVLRGQDEETAGNPAGDC
jgi:hypothetical protein